MRPYESLWILTQRFLWLNGPGRTDLVKTIAVPQKEDDCFNLVFAYKPTRRFEQQQLRSLLGLSLAQWGRAHSRPKYSSRSDLFRGAILHALLRVWLSYSCLSVAHRQHRSRASLRTRLWMSELRQKISTSLSPCSLRFPFACSECKTALVKSALIIDPPCLGSLPGIACIAKWYQWMAELPRIEAAPGGKRTPSLVNMNRQRVVEGTVRAVTCGMLVMPSSANSFRVITRSESERPQRPPDEDRVQLAAASGNEQLLPLWPLQSLSWMHSMDSVSIAEETPWSPPNFSIKALYIGIFCQQQCQWCLSGT